MAHWSPKRHAKTATTTTSSTALRETSNQPTHHQLLNHHHHHLTTNPSLDSPLVSPFTSPTYEQKNPTRFSEIGSPTSPTSFQTPFQTPAYDHKKSRLGDLRTPTTSTPSRTPTRWRTPNRKTKRSPAKSKPIFETLVDDPLSEEPGLLLVRILRAYDLAEAPVPREPYCLVTFTQQQARTRNAKASTHPKWDAMFDFIVGNKKTEKLKVSVIGTEVVGTEVNLGFVEIPIVNLLHFEMTDLTVDLFGTETGSLKLKLRYLSLNPKRFLNPEDVPLLFSPKRFKNEIHYDRYGYIVPSREAYEEALKNESSYSPDPPNLALGTQKAARVGIGFAFKARYWQIFAMKYLKLKKSPFVSGLYQELLKQQGNPVLLSQIDKDLPRTFPHHPVFMSTEGREALGRILKAFSIKHPNIGYTQAMNFIAGYLLLLMEEELAFKLLTVIVEQFVPGYYASNMAGLQADQAVLNMLVKEKLPNLYDHFEAINIDINVVTTKWFMCLFINVLPFPSVLRIWDILFCKGSSALILAALAILKVKEDEILKRVEFGHSTEYLDSMCQTYYQWGELIDIMYGTCTFTQVDKLQEEQRAQIDINLKATQIKELGGGTRFSEVELEDLFKRFTSESINGTLDKEGFFKIFPEQYRHFINDTDIREYLFGEFDKSGDGILTFRHYCQGLSKICRGTPKEKIKFCFHVFDRDKDGFIGKEELRTMLTWQFKSMGFKQEETLQMVQTSVTMGFDEIESDKLTPEEFAKVCEKQPLLVQMLQLV